MKWEGEKGATQLVKSEPTLFLQPDLALHHLHKREDGPGAVPQSILCTTSSLAVQRMLFFFSFSAKLSSLKSGLYNGMSQKQGCVSGSGNNKLNNLF
jgi:hypothetical protein